MINYGIIKMRSDDRATHIGDEGNNHNIDI